MMGVEFQQKKYDTIELSFHEEHYHHMYMVQTICDDDVLHVRVHTKQS